MQDSYGYQLDLVVHGSSLSSNKSLKMFTRSIKRRLLKAKMSLSNTIQKILDINQKKKVLSHMEDADPHKELLESELRILNKVAEHQANLIKGYEKVLAKQEQGI